MRRMIGGVWLGLLLACGALALGACQRQSEPAAEAEGGPSNAEREAQIAAEQLAALGGPATPAQRALFEGEFQASGGLGAPGAGAGADMNVEEGAWELRLLNDYAQFSRPGLGEDGGVAGDRDYRAGGFRVAAGPLTITISNQACASSGGEMAYTAHVLFEGVAYQGCARRGVDEGDRPTWALVLPDLIGPIDACLARASARPARVTFASPLDEGEVSVRLRESDGSRHECITDTAGAEVHLYETLSDLDRRGGEGDPEFVRGAAQPRAQSCREISPALSRAGEQLGWLIRNSC